LEAFDIEIFESPGGYICGEETALLEALEGKRAEPRNRPPFPATHGLWGCPTVINNVETFAWIPSILVRGAEWFRNGGVNGATGLKFLALSGHVQRPGVYEVPLGIRATEFIQQQGGGMQGGRSLMAFSPGGASSGFLPASLADTPLDFKSLSDVGSMLGSGALIAVAEGTEALAMAHNVVRFFRDESCGKCVPCRVGTEKAVQLLEQTLSGKGRADLPSLLEELGQTLAQTSICGLGQAALNPALSVFRHFSPKV
jgi:NADH:ubiquinone oxidoreductase subunit F (NADH-binding)